MITGGRHYYHCSKQLQITAQKVKRKLCTHLMFYAAEESVSERQHLNFKLQNPEHLILYILIPKKGFLDHT